MSTWTNVAGLIRIDDFRSGAGKTPSYKEIVRRLGKRNSWEETVKLGMDSDIETPCGREGSLNWKIDVSKNKSSMAAYAISIWGDLRSYEDVDEVKEWFLNILKGMMIRQAILTIEIYGRSPVICIYDEVTLSLLTFTLEDLKKNSWSVRDQIDEEESVEV